MIRGTRRLAISPFDSPLFDAIPFAKFWKGPSAGGDGLEGQTHRAIPRHIHGYFESYHPRTQQHIQYYPYKKEMSVDGVLVPTVMDIIYMYYFPRELTDDERIRYVSLKSNRTEEDVAEELFQMRRLKMFAAASLRNKVAGKPFRLPEGSDFSARERSYLIGSARAAQVFGTNFFTNHSYQPTILYSPNYGIGDCIDGLFEKSMRLSLQYVLIDVVTHRAVPRVRLPTVKGESRYPLESVEPCLYEALRLRLAILALIAQKEQYVVDHEMDTHHKYSASIVHLNPVLDSPTEIDASCYVEDLDLELGQKVLDHYYRNYVLPRRDQTVT